MPSITIEFSAGNRQTLILSTDAILYYLNKTDIPLYYQGKEIPQTISTKDQLSNWFLQFIPSGSAVTTSVSSTSVTSPIGTVPSTPTAIAPLNAPFIISYLNGYPKYFFDGLTQKKVEIGIKINRLENIGIVEQSIKVQIKGTNVLGQRILFEQIPITNWTDQDYYHTAVLQEPANRPEELEIETSMVNASSLLRSNIIKAVKNLSGATLPTQQKPRDKYSIIGIFAGLLGVSLLVASVKDPFKEQKRYDKKKTNK